MFALAQAPADHAHRLRTQTEPLYLVLRQEISLRHRPHRRGRRPMPGWRHRGRVPRRRRALLHTSVRTAGQQDPRPTLFFSGRCMSERWRRRPTRGSACGTPRGHDQQQREQNWSIRRADHGPEACHRKRAEPAIGAERVRRVLTACDGWRCRPASHAAHVRTSPDRAGY